jgi:hypothetical protein
MNLSRDARERRIAEDQPSLRPRDIVVAYRLSLGDRVAGGIDRPAIAGGKYYTGIGQ